MRDDSGSLPGGRGWTRHPLTWIGAVTLALVMAVGLWAFQPWRLFTSTVVAEELPEVAQDSAAEAAEDNEPEPEPVLMAEGEFVSQEHETSGTARVIELADGSRHVRIEDLVSSDGPDLYVWLTDQEAGGDWSKYRDGRYLDLGDLKGTHGDANYEIPADADIEGMTSVVIWCDRFSKAFGSAPVEL